MYTRVNRNVLRVKRENLDEVKSIRKDKELSSSLFSHSMEVRKFSLPGFMRQKGTALF